jgi:phosphatidate cytidylyltransferase
LLSTRILTSIVLLAAFGSALILLGRTEFAVLVAFFVAVGAHEWGKLSHFRPRATLAYAGSMTVLFAGLLWMSDPIQMRQTVLQAVFAGSLIMWLVLLPVWLRAGVGRRPQWLLPVAGFAVLLPAALAMVVMQRSQLLLALGVVWVSDTAAFFAGRAFGRHKLAPGISPGKTWEGVAGAFLATAGYAIICALAVPQIAARVQGVIWLAYLAGAELLLLASILGDLFESALKRQASVKDSGSLLPGHGGVLDRIDSATAVLPIAALLMYWMAKT